MHNPRSSRGYIWKSLGWSSRLEAEIKKIASVGATFLPFCPVLVDSWARSLSHTITTSSLKPETPVFRCRVHVGCLPFFPVEYRVPTVCTCSLVWSVFFVKSGRRARSGSSVIAPLRMEQPLYSYTAATFAGRLERKSGEQTLPLLLLLLTIADQSSAYCSQQELFSFVFSPR